MLNRDVIHIHSEFEENISSKIEEISINRGPGEIRPVFHERTFSPAFS